MVTDDHGAYTEVVDAMGWITDLPPLKPVCHRRELDKHRRIPSHRRGPAPEQVRTDLAQMQTSANVQRMEVQLEALYDLQGCTPRTVRHGHRMRMAVTLVLAAI